MITIGPVVKNTLNKDFPDCWKSMAALLGLQFEMTTNNTIVELTFKDNISCLTISADNSIEANFPIDKESIAGILISQVKKTRKL